ncbi:MAG: hypothetical protein K8L97_31250 [Anaerolineae bacterium]|nr:hypothetical protein [Anaerolineae bacterium]
MVEILLGKRVSATGETSATYDALRQNLLNIQTFLDTGNMPAAQQVYGDGNRWREIYNVNRNIISDPNRIYAGQILNIPGRSAANVANVSWSNTTSCGTNHDILMKSGGGGTYRSGDNCSGAQFYASAGQYKYGAVNLSQKVFASRLISAYQPVEGVYAYSTPNKPKLGTTDVKPFRLSAEQYINVFNWVQGAIPTVFQWIDNGLYLISPSKKSYDEICMIAGNGIFDDLNSTDVACTWGS